MSQVITKPTTRKRSQVAAAAANVVSYAGGNGPDGPSIRTSMDEIADEAQGPVTKSEIPAGGLDARMQGNNVANRVIATVRQDSKGVWRRFALEVISLTTDGRVQFLKAIKEWLTEARALEKKQTAAHQAWVDAGSVAKDKPEASKEERKAAAARVNSATVEVSKLMTIATAWNGQAHEPDLLAYFKRVSGKAAERAEDVPYERIVEYARTFKPAAAGRKADPFILRIVKALEACKPRTDEGDPDGPADVELHAALVALVKTAAATNPAAQAAAAEPRGL